MNLYSFKNYFDYTLLPYFRPSYTEISEKYDISVYNVFAITFLCTSIVILATYLIWLARRTSIKLPTQEDVSHFKPRFRKRDKLMYYANQIEHKFHDLTEKIKAIKSQDEKTMLMVNYTKSFLGLKKEEKSPSLLPHFPNSYLKIEEEEETTLPHDLKLFNDAMGVFSQIDKTICLTLFDHVVYRKILANEFLFLEEDPKNFIYIVKSGCVDVMIRENNEYHVINKVKKGSSIHSLVVCLKAMIGRKPRFNALIAKCSEDTEVFCLPEESFAKCLDKIQLARIIQTITVRFQHTNFIALNEYLNLNSELYCQGEEPILASAKIFDFLDQPQISTPEESSDSLPVANSKSDKNLKQNIRKLFGRLSSTKQQKKISSATSFAKMSLTEAAKRDLFRIFNLSEESNDIFDESIVLKSYPKGTIIDKPHEFQTGLLYVIDGVIDVQTTYYSSKKSSAEIFETKSYSVFPGQLTSILGLITGEPSYLQLIAAKDTVCAVVPRDSFYRILRKSPNSLLPMYSLACEKMSSLLFQIYYSITWITVKAGKALFRSGDPSEEFYIVLHGRLRQISIDPVTQENILISELTKGHAAGLVEMMTNQKRKYTIMAIRDTECACLPKLLINWLRNKHQKVLERLLQIVFSNAFDHASFPMNNIPISRQQTYAHILDPSTLSFANIKPKDEDILLTGSNNQINTVGCSSFLPVFSKTLANLKTIAIIPATSNINGEAFALELQQALSAHSSAIRITSNILYERMGPSALDKSQNYRFLSWLSHIEESRDIVLLVGDPSKDSLWTQKCIEQCDTILVLHHAKEAEALMNNETAVENYLSQSYTKTTKILILMHHDDVIAPVIGQTVQWLRTRPWICQHYHIKCPRRVMNMRTSKELNEIYSQILQHEHPNPLNDMSRLARYLTGRAVGIVLGGGGARGCSHVGVVRAFQEAGIPIDMVGGTSIGAFMGALWAKENKIHKFAQAARDFSNNFGPLWKKITDLTYPAVSFFTGSNFNNDIYRAIGDVQIEDLWLPYFNVTTDITNCKMRVHTNGSLWRYVRSSMTLTGYLPPLCDPYDGAYLLDGGYMNNLAADVMASLGAKTIFAVDVGSSIDTNLTDYGDFISGWWYLWKTFFSSSFRVPNMIEIQSRLAYVSCVKHLEQVKESGICHYLRPPIEKYLTLQFNLFDEISEVGYKYGRSMIEKWSKDPEMIRELASISVDLSPLKSQKKTFYTKMKDLKKYAINIFDESEYPTIDLGDVLDEFELCSQSISNMLLNSGINGKIDRRRTSSFNIDYLSKKKVSSHEDDSLKSKLTVASKDEILVTLKEQNDNKVTFGLHSESDEEDSMYLTNSREEYELITNSDPENNLNSYQPLAKKINQKKRRLLRYRSEQRRFSSDEI